MRPSQLLAAVVALSSVSAAWPDVFDTNAFGEVKNVLYGRADDATTTQAETSADAKKTDSAESTQATESAKATESGDNNDSKTTDKASASGSGSGKASKTSGKLSATNFAADLPAGGIQMVTPSAIAGAQFYKIGDFVTFAWNYTSLSVTPSAIDIMASCTANQATYTIAVNQTVKETGMVLWDTKSYAENNQNTPLLTETYTLVMYDAASSISATARPGYLATYNQFTFGMYKPQEYTPWADFKCANCNDALSLLEKMTLKALFFTCATTIASLLYFTASFGLW